MLEALKGIKVTCLFYEAVMYTCTHLISNYDVISDIKFGPGDSFISKGGSFIRQGSLNGQLHQT